MGIFIYEAISESVTKEEWKQVYEETLVLVKAFPLAEIGTITYAGKTIMCTVRSKEQVIGSGMYKRFGWNASMDYDTLEGAEDYFLPKDLVRDRQVYAKAGDAILGVLPIYLDYDWNDEICSHTYSLWDSKTQGKPYHIYLLAIACLIEDRLSEKAFVYGDITLGQCRKAVKMANMYLKKPIHVPAHCDMDRLYKRVQKLPLEEAEKVAIFECSYLGAKDKNFYEFENQHFSSITIEQHWKKILSTSIIGTRGFYQDLKRYLSAGLNIEKLCNMVHLERDGKPQYEKFIIAIMNSKLHQKEKNTRDCLDINPEMEHPYGIDRLFATFTFGDAHNPRVDRYVPIEEIRTALKNGIGTKCDVDQYIDQYLKEEAAAPEINIAEMELSEDKLEHLSDADKSEVFQQFIDKSTEEVYQKYDKYEIVDYEDLFRYKNGNTVEPELVKSLVSSFKIYHSAVKEQCYKDLMKKTYEERSAFLIEQNQYLMLRDIDWKHIFSEIQNNPDVYERYYPMVRVKCDSTSLNQIVRGFVLNDDLYAFVEGLSNEDYKQ